MRIVQRGISVVFLAIAILGVTMAIASGYFIFYQNREKLQAVNSFEDCSKYYPVMKSYPEQCNTLNGKHFIRELSDEEKKRLVPPSDSGKVCAQVITPAKDPKIGECKEFPTPCDVPEDWEKVGSCDNQQTAPDVTNMSCGGPLTVEPNQGCLSGYHCGDIQTVGGEFSGRCIKN